MAAIVVGPRNPQLVRDDLFERTYTVEWVVHVTHTETTDGDGLVTSRTLDGPATALEADGLPVVGDTWSFGNDNDGGAWCRPGVQVRPDLEAEPNTGYILTYTYSSRPLANCQDGVIEDPLLQPPRISKGGRQERVEATVDRFGRPILSSSHEQIRGPQVEFNHTISTVRIVDNQPFFDGTLDFYENRVNEHEMWGYPPRTVRLARAGQECRYTARCVSMVERTLEFEIDLRTWDRNVLDEGTKAIRGRWVDRSYVVDADADPANPQHFVRFTDYVGNPMRAVLDGFGRPADVPVYSDSYYLSLQPDNEGNPLSDTAYWVALSGDVEGTAWAAETGWKRGQVVTQDGQYLVALRDVRPSEDVSPLDQPELWAPVGSFAPAVVGPYDSSNAYALAQVVTDAESRPPGSVLVSYYEGAEFEQLGVPTVLDCPD